MKVSLLRRPPCLRRSIYESSKMASSREKYISVEMEALLECPICMETLNEPRSLPCFHNFCKVCLEKYVEGLRGGKNIETFPCPTCRSQFTLKVNQAVAQMPGNFFIRNMLEVMAIQQEAKVSSCQCCEAAAVCRCLNCEMFMCQNCSNYHGKFPGNKKHSVLSIDELGDPEGQAKIKSKLYCKKHPEKTLKFYCETCKELSCTHCMVLTHNKQNHSCVSVDEVAQKQRDILESSCSTLDEKLSEAKKALDNISGVLKSLGENATATKEKISDQKKNVLKIVVEKLDERAKEMSEEVDKIYGELHADLSSQYDEIKSYIDKVQGSVSLPRNLLMKGSIEEILSSQKVIDENVEKLKNEQPEDLEAVNDGGIEYIPPVIDNVNVDHLVKKLGCVGSRSNLSKSSSILKEEVAFVKQLRQWLGDKCKWNLCYRASRDGWGAQDFHRHCDNKGPTVVLVKADNYIFGGYADQSWTGNKGWTHSNSSFLFSLRNKENLAPFVAKLKPGKEQHAMYCDPGYGPIFGGGHDLRICDNAQVKQGSYTYFGTSYQPPLGTRDPLSLLSGSNNFAPKEIEVFV